MMAYYYRESPMKAYYYREYVSNEGLLLQRVSLQWRLTITESKSPMKAYYYRECYYYRE